MAGISQGRDGNLYMAGTSVLADKYGGFTVVCVSPGGRERWVYVHERADSSSEEAHSIVSGRDGNQYVAGYIRDSLTSGDFAVISLAPDGSERWVYRCADSVGWIDMAYAIASDSLGNIYATGATTTLDGCWDVTVVSLTAEGTERWVYRHDGGAHYWDAGTGIVCGPDGCLYVCATSYESNDGAPDIAVISLTPDGRERWVYSYNYLANDLAYSICCGADGNIYVCGISRGVAYKFDAIVLSLTRNGYERWVYRYDGPGHGRDDGLALTCGSDSNLYVACQVDYGDSSGCAFGVLSLNTDGRKRWVRLIQRGSARAICAGPGGSVYAAGYLMSSDTSWNMSVVCFDTAGTERWRNLYDGGVNYWDEGNTVMLGRDGHVYAAGETWNEGKGYDMTLVSLESRIEPSPPPLSSDFRVVPSTFQHGKLVVSLSAAFAAQVVLSVFDPAGRKLASSAVRAPRGESQHTLAVGDLAMGAYFLRAENTVTLQKAVAKVILAEFQPTPRASRDIGGYR